MPGIFDSVQEWWARGRADPLQFVDSVTPGDWRQGGQFNRDGLIAGAGQVATGIPAALTQPIIGRIGGMLGGRSGDIGRGVADPLRYADDTNAISNAAANYRAGTSTLNRSEQQMADERNRVGDADTGAMAGVNRPSFGGNNMTAHSGPGGTISSQRGLGLGQLGRGGDESLAAFAASLFTRGGTQAEQ